MICKREAPRAANRVRLHIENSVFKTTKEVAAQLPPPAQDLSRHFITVVKFINTSVWN